jgi:hypothetical protein
MIMIVIMIMIILILYDYDHELTWLITLGGGGAKLTVVIRNFISQRSQI